MIIEYSEVDESRVRWNRGGEWKSADIEELIEAFEWKQSIPRHGRLIDADALKVHHGINVGANYGGLRAVVFKKDIDNAPTIIEADRSRER